MVSIKPKYKVVFRTRFNLWSNVNFLLKKKFKKLKWRSIRIKSFPTIKKKINKRYYSLRYLSFLKKRYIRNFYFKKSLQLMFGYKNKKSFNKFYFYFYKKNKNSSQYYQFLISLYTKLDVILFGLKFTKSVFHSQELIINGFISINGFIITNKCYILRPCDKFSLNSLKKIKVYRKKLYYTVHNLIVFSKKKNINIKLVYSFFLFYYKEFFETSYSSFSSVYLYKPRIQDLLVSNIDKKVERSVMFKS